MNFGRIRDRVKASVDRLLLGGTLRAKAMRGGVFLAGGSVAEQAIRFVRNMLLARLLAPGAFGAMAIVNASASIVGTLTEVGLKASVIQNPRGGEKEYLNASWWMGMGRAICTYLIIFAMAPLVAHFYGNSELSPLLRVALLSVLFDGAMSPRSVLPQKEMKFERWVAISNGGGISGVILTIILSFVLRDVWALAIGACSESAFRFILSYILCPGLPSLRWNGTVARDLYSYSRGVIGLSFLNLIFIRTDIFVLGKLLSTTQLGIYTMGVGLIQTPAVFLVAMLAQTLFPAFAHVQGDNERINRILIEVSSWLILLGLPVVVVVFLCGQSLLSVVYGTRYAAAAGPLALATAVVFLNALNASITCVFSGVGRPELHRRAVAASAVVMIIVIYPACKLLGMVGGQVAALLAISASYLLQIVRMRGLTGLKLFRYGRAFLPAGLVSAGVLVVGLSARSFGLATRPLANIALSASACVIAYALCVPAFLKIKQDPVGSPSSARVDG
jgi:O-antigen/teichoic acid export membrane protein